MNDSLSMTTFEMCFFFYFFQAIVFVVGGGNYIEYQNLVDYAMVEHSFSIWGEMFNGNTKVNDQYFYFYSAILRIRKLSFMEPVKFSMHHSSLNRYETWFLFHVRQYFHASHVLLLLLCSWKFWDVNLHLNGISVFYCTS
jgi:hypothetical protein